MAESLESECNKWPLGRTDGQKLASIKPSEYASSIPKRRRYISNGNNRMHKNYAAACSVAIKRKQVRPLIDGGHTVVVGNSGRVLPGMPHVVHDFIQPDSMPDLRKQGNGPSPRIARASRSMTPKSAPTASAKIRLINDQQVGLRDARTAFARRSCPRPPRQSRKSYNRPVRG